MKRSTGTPNRPRGIAVRTQWRAGSSSRYLEVNCDAEQNKELCQAYVACFDGCMDDGGSSSGCKAKCDAYFSLPLDPSPVKPL